MDVRLPEPAVAGPAVPRAGEHRLAGRLAGWGLLAVLATLCALAVLPTLLWRMPEPKPIHLASLDGQVSGTYLALSNGFLKLVPYADPLPQLPGQVPVADSQPQILVRARQLDLPQTYTLMTWGSDHAVALTRTPQGGHTIALVPSAPLAAAYYYIRAARDSADQAYDYFYFQVKDTQ